MVYILRSLENTETNKINRYNIDNTTTFSENINSMYCEVL